MNYLVYRLPGLTAVGYNGLTGIASLVVQNDNSVTDESELFIASSQGFIYKCLLATQVCTTIAGITYNGGPAFTADGNPAQGNYIRPPSDVAVDPAGN